MTRQQNTIEAHSLRWLDSPRRRWTYQSHNQKNGNSASRLVFVKAATPATKPRIIQPQIRDESLSSNSRAKTTINNSAERLLSHNRTEAAASSNEHDQNHAASSPAHGPITGPKIDLPMRTRMTAVNP